MIEHRFPIGPQLWEVCDTCNLGGHRCAGCGDDIPHADARGFTPDDRIHWCYSKAGMRSFGIGA